eukprot:32484-Prymnesium_polylepis.1
MTASRIGSDEPQNFHSMKARSTAPVMTAQKNRSCTCVLPKSPSVLARQKWLYRPQVLLMRPPRIKEAIDALAPNVPLVTIALHGLQPLLHCSCSSGERAITASMAHKCEHAVPVGVVTSAMQSAQVDLLDQPADVAILPLEYVLDE